MSAGDGNLPGYEAAVGISDSKTEPDEADRKLVPSGLVTISFAFSPNADGKKFRFQSAFLKTYSNYEDPALIEMIESMNEYPNRSSPYFMNLRCTGELTIMGYRVVTVEVDTSSDSRICTSYIYFTRPV